MAQNQSEGNRNSMLVLFETGTLALRGWMAHRFGVLAAIVGMFSIGSLVVINEDSQKLDKSVRRVATALALAGSAVGLWFAPALTAVLIASTVISTVIDEKLKKLVPHHSSVLAKASLSALSFFTLFAGVPYVFGLFNASAARMAQTLSQYAFNNVTIGTVLAESFIDAKYPNVQHANTQYSEMQQETTGSEPQQEQTSESAKPRCCAA